MERDELWGQKRWIDAGVKIRFTLSRFMDWSFALMTILKFDSVLNGETVVNADRAY